MAIERINSPKASVEHADAVVIGLGALGLMLTKYLTDFGQKVVAVESNSQLAYGPSIKNHGWLHNGIIHAVPGKEANDNPVERRRIVKSLQFGRHFFSAYAPEALDQPFNPTYAYTSYEDRAAVARENWMRHNVPYREVDKASFIRDIEPNFNPEQGSYFFENDDARINNRLLFKKLSTDAQRKGAVIVRAANYHYVDDYTIAVSQADDEIFRVRSPLFFYATGPNLDESYEKLTGESLGMEYYKSHLLLLPRVTNESLVTLDGDSPIIINHGDVSVVNRARDDKRVENKDVDVDPEETERTFDMLCRTIPSARRFHNDMKTIACIKPSIPLGASTGKHNVDSVQLEPIPGHIFGSAGKMTLAPSIAANFIHDHASMLDLNDITPRPADTFLGERLDIKEEIPDAIL